MKIIFKQLNKTSTVGVLEMYDLDTKQIMNIVNQDLQENRMNLFLGARMI